MPRELKAVAVKEIAFRDYELPELAEDQVRVRTRFAAAKHGTEMALFKGYAGARGPWNRELALHEPADEDAGFPQFTIGNMFVGEVTGAGEGVDQIEVGDRVLAYGGFREVQTVSATRCWKIPDHVGWKSAVCLDPADFAMGAVRDGCVRVGDAVAIFGMGAIGLMAVQIAKRSGAAPVIAVEPLANRRSAAAALGADRVLDPNQCDAGREIKLATDGRGADACIEYSGNVHALQHALRGVAYGGKVVAGAFPPPYPAGLDLGAEAHMNIPDIVFSRACSEPNREAPRWDEARIYATCWRMICGGLLSGEEIVTPVVPFEDAADAYVEILAAPEKNIKLGVEF